MFACWDVHTYDKSSRFYSEHEETKPKSVFSILFVPEAKLVFSLSSTARAPKMLNTIHFETNNMLRCLEFMWIVLS